MSRSNKLNPPTPIKVIKKKSAKLSVQNSSRKHENTILFKILVRWLRDKILFYEQNKCVECVAASMKHTFSCLRDHPPFNFNSHVFIDQMVWYVPCMVRFVLKRGPFCPGRGPFCPGRGPFCPWSVLSMVRFVPNSPCKRHRRPRRLHNDPCARPRSSYCIVGTLLRGYGDLTANPQRSY